MRISSLRLAISLLLAAGCTAVSPAPNPPPPSAVPVVGPAVNYTQIERDVMHLVNLERMRRRLDTLRWNPQLDKAAKVQAVEMAAEHKMAHDLPGAAYPTLKDRIRYVGYGYRHIAENIAYGYPSADYTVAAWMKSSGHRMNILDRSSVETGVGVVRAETGELYYCQVFGARLY
jgi:uncharacterized protein YkwD